MTATLWEQVADLIDPPGEVFRLQPKQQIATDLAHQVDEMLYGGAAGGGKTEWLLRYMIDLCESYDGIRTIVFRRVYPSLSRTVIPRSKAILWNRAKWNSQEKTWTFPNNSVLEFGTLQYLDDVHNYQGAEYACIGFEEITEFAEQQVDYLIGRLRTTLENVRPHMVATTNPGGVGHRWVKRRWVKPTKDDLEPGEMPPSPGETWRPVASEELPNPPLRAFVAATLQDNPALLERDPGYLDRLMRNKNRATRQALSKGDWDAIDAVEGALWTAEDLDAGRVRPEYLDRIGVARRIIALDPSDGESDGDAFGVCHAALGTDGIGYVLSAHEWRASPRTMARQAIEMYHEVGADALVIEKNHGGKWMLDTFRQEDPNVNIKVVWASDGKRTRAEPVAALFEKNPEKLIQFGARIAGYHEDLEAELTQHVFSVKPGEKAPPSPNMLDAMVWAMTDLVIRGSVARRRDQRDERLAGRR